MWCDIGYRSNNITGRGLQLVLQMSRFLQIDFLFFYLLFFALKNIRINRDCSEKKANADVRSNLLSTAFRIPYHRRCNKKKTIKSYGKQIRDLWPHKWKPWTNPLLLLSNVSYTSHGIWRGFKIGVKFLYKDKYYVSRVTSKMPGKLMSMSNLIPSRLCFAVTYSSTVEITSICRGEKQKVRV